MNGYMFGLDMKQCEEVEINFWGYYYIFDFKL